MLDAQALTAWYREGHRPLPWRETRDPYLIWISEVILQQTRVAQGLDYYTRFTGRFPDVRALAAAPSDEVMRLWQGLGYYSRARNLHAAAKQVCEQYGGIFPTRYDEVRALKGIGDYTAAAITSFSTDAPYAVLDGNVFRVLSRLFDIDTPIDTTAGKKQFAALAQSELNHYMTRHDGLAGEYNQAIMELGATVCTPRSPDCSHCPVSRGCLALQRGTIPVRPVKQGKTRQTPRYFSYLHLTDPAGETLLTLRTGRDIWQGLYEFPLIESEAPLDFGQLAQMPPFRELMQHLAPHGDYLLRESVRMPRHVLSHRIIHAVFHRIALPGPLPRRLPEGLIRVAPGQIDDYAIARLTELYLESRASRAGTLFPG